MKEHLGPFVAIGALGFLLQIIALAALTNGAGWHYALATVVAVECAVLHNFWWHLRWTWSDRFLVHEAPVKRLSRLVRFHLANGLVSIAGNVLFTAALVTIADLSPVPANALAVGLTTIANYLLADRWVFADDLAVRRSNRRDPRLACRSALGTDVTTS